MLKSFEFDASVLLNFSKGYFISQDTRELRILRKLGLVKLVSIFDFPGAFVFTITEDGRQFVLDKLS